MSINGKPGPFHCSNIVWVFDLAEGRPGMHQCSARLHLSLAPAYTFDERDRRHGKKNRERNRHNWETVVDHWNETVPAAIRDGALPPFTFTSASRQADVLLPLGTLPSEKAHDCAADVGEIPENWRRQAEDFRDRLVALLNSGERIAGVPEAPRSR